MARPTATISWTVVATYKDGDGKPYVKFTGTFDECQDYADRNNSPDNPERYAVRKAAPSNAIGSRR